MFKRKFIKSLDSVEYKFNPLYNSRCSVLRTPNLMDSFYLEIYKNKDSNYQEIRLVNDVNLFLSSKKKLQKLDPDQLKSWLKDNLASSGQDLTGKLSDDTLISFIKSRHIQAPCDLLAWSGYLLSMRDKVNRDYGDRLDTMLYQKEPTVEPPKTE